MRRNGVSLNIRSYNTIRLRLERANKREISQRTLDIIRTNDISVISTIIHGIIVWNNLYLIILAKATHS